MEKKNRTEPDKLIVFLYILFGFFTSVAIFCGVLAALLYFEVISYSDLPFVEANEPQIITPAYVNTQSTASQYTAETLPTTAKLPLKFLAQNPELPTGCEITSLTTVLNYYGYNVSKTEMAENYLVKETAPANFWEVFAGDPTSEKYGFGCYAQPIVNAANKYLTEQNSPYRAYNRSGSPFKALLAHVANGTPVVIWGTISMLEPYTTEKWTFDGEAVEWIAPEHCLVLIGYDLERNVAIMSDPLKDIVEYDLDTVEARYHSLHSQCVIVKKQNS